MSHQGYIQASNRPDIVFVTHKPWSIYASCSAHGAAPGCIWFSHWTSSMSSLRRSSSSWSSSPHSTDWKIGRRVGVSCWTVWSSHLSVQSSVTMEPFFFFLLLLGSRDTYTAGRSCGTVARSPRSRSSEAGCGPARAAHRRSGRSHGA